MISWYASCCEPACQTRIRHAIRAEAGADAAGCCAQASDMFAFGMLLVSMLTSEAPWAGRSGPQIVLAAGILRLRPPLPPHAPPPLASLIDLCLRAEPTERPTFEMAAAVVRGLLIAMGEQGPAPAEC